MSRRWVAYPALITGALACQGVLFSISIEEEDQILVEQGTLVEALIGDLGFGQFVSMNLVAAEELENQGVAPGDIEDVYLVRFELEATDPPGADLAFIDRMDLLVSAPGLPEVLIASAESFGPGQRLVSFAVEEVNLTDYLVSEALTLTTDVTAGRPEVDTTVTARFELDVGVTGQGACNQVKGGGS